MRSLSLSTQRYEARRSAGDRPQAVPDPKPTFAKMRNGAKCELMRDFAGRGCAIYR